MDVEFKEEELQLITEKYPRITNIKVLQACLLIALGRSKTEACNKLDLGQSTLYRWLAEVEECNQLINEMADTNFNAMKGEAVKRIQQLMYSDNDNVALKASIYVKDKTTKEEVKDDGPSITIINDFNGGEE